ncbi:MAG TPA: hypothetical protein VMD59_09750, partial [Acidimicrobiales bacterium]|nr:hypothetical protein [Acidimicrobiales bacterium]
MPGPVVAICAARLGMHDGVSIEAGKWAAALARLGCSLRLVAGAGTADVLVPALASDAATPPDLDELAAAFA